MIGRQLKELRESRGLSQEGLARILGVAVHTVWRWENPKPKPGKPLPQPKGAAAKALEKWIRDG